MRDNAFFATTHSTHSTHSSECVTTHSSTSNEIRSTTEQPIRRSQRIQERSNTAKL